MKDYELIKKIGQGAYGTVYKARRKKDGKVFVLKQIALARSSKKDLRDAENEVAILKSLNHRYVVRYHDSYFDGGKLCIVMEHCAGGDLGSLLKTAVTGLDENTVWRYFIQICLGLKYIHSKKVLHRDMKTTNIFLTEEKEVRIGDLGVARQAQDPSMFAQTVVGTPYYLSPELCEERPYNEKSDVWALGCIVYELCARAHPFTASNQAALALKIIKGSYAPIPASYSQDLAELVALMLTRDYWKRPTTCQLLALDSRTR